MGTVGQFSVIFLPALSRIIQTKFIAVAQLRKILSKNANLSSSLAPPLPLNHSAKHIRSAVFPICRRVTTFVALFTILSFR